MLNRVVIPGLLLMLLVACGGSGTTDQLPDTPGNDQQPAPPEVTITSHEDGETVTGSRMVVFAGALASEISIEDVTVLLNGEAAEVEFDQESFSAEVTLVNNVNRLEVVVTDSEGETASDQITLTFPFLELENFQAASLVIGQPDFESSDAGLGPDRLDLPFANPLVHAGRLYLPDFGNDRVLVFDTVPQVNGAEASLVLGQPDFASDVPDTTASSFNGPGTIVTDGSRIYVADYDNHRILVWNEPPSVSGAPADLVIGQPDMFTSGTSCSANGFSSPESMTIAGGKLIVTDSDNNRVLIWNDLPEANGASADTVLGQASLDTCASNDDDQNGVSDDGPSARTLDYPADVWSDGERLIVTDTDNYRVLIWNSFPTASFQPADIVLGQPDFVSVESEAGGFGFPYYLDSNGNQLFVADEDLGVLVWNEIPTENNTPAELILGRDGSGGDASGPASARTIGSASGIHLAGDRLFIADALYNRVLLFE